MIYMSKQNRQTGINAAAWFSQQTFAGRIEPEAILPKISATVPVERWVDDKWVTVQVPNPALRGEK